MLNVALYAVLRLASWLLGFVPPAVMYRLARAGGWCAYYLVRGAREAVTDNLAVVLGQTPASSVVRATARSAFEHDAMNWIDTLRIGRMSLGEIEQIVRVDDWAPLESGAGTGRGLIIVTLHLGNFDLVGQVLAARGYRLTVPVERMRPQALFDFLVQQRTRNGITVVPVQHASRELIRALRAGELVGLAGDRNVAGKTAAVPVFGKPAALPTGPVSLARRTGCPLIVGVGIRERPGQFRGILRNVPMTYSGDAARDDAENLESFTRIMEQIVAQHPEQWLVFSPFWNIDTGENTAATMGHQKRAAL